MDSSAAQADRPAPSRQKRSRKDPVRQEIYRWREDYEKVDPKPVAILGPVPSIAEQTAALMQNPRWLIQQMQMEGAESPTDESQFDWDDDDDLGMFTGYEVVDMEPIVSPEDKAEATQTSEPEPLMGDSDPVTNPSGAENSA